MKYILFKRVRKKRKRMPSEKIFLTSTHSNELRSEQKQYFSYYKSSASKKKTPKMFIKNLVSPKSSLKRKSLSFCFNLYS